MVHLRVVLNVGEELIPTYQMGFDLFQELLESLMPPGGHTVCGCHPADAELGTDHVVQELLLDGGDVRHGGAIDSWSACR